VPFSPALHLQVLQLPDDLATAVYQSSTVHLDTCLAHFPPYLHTAALRACFPAVVTQRVLRIDAACARWPVAPLCSPRKPSQHKCCVASHVVLCSMLKAISSFPQLRELHLDVNCSDLGSCGGPLSAADMLFSSVLPTLTQVTALSVGSAFLDTRHHVIQWPLKTSLDDLPLESLSVLHGPVNLTPELVAFLERCTALVSLHIQRLCGFLTSKHVWHRLCLPSLRHLSLPEAQLGLENVAALSAGVKRLTSLCSLHLPRLVVHETSSSYEGSVSLLRACAALPNLVCTSLHCF
jgi:hypothetical protein